MQETKIPDWLEDLASKNPTPGGGAVAALSAAISAAQLGMVVAYTTGPKWQTVAAQMKIIGLELTKIRTQALELVDVDAAAFSAVGSAYKLPKESDSEKTTRQEAIQSALINAAEPPIETSHLAMKLVDFAVELAEKANPNVISDVAVGASLAKAALESAIVNIEINMHSISDDTVKKKLIAAIEDATDSIQDADGVIETVRDKMGNS